jgi:hypothetical protein
LEFTGFITDPKNTKIINTDLTYNGHSYGLVYTSKTYPWIQYIDRLALPQSLVKAAGYSYGPSPWLANAIPTNYDTQGSYKITVNVSRSQAPYLANTVDSSLYVIERDAGYIYFNGGNWITGTPAIRGVSPLISFYRYNELVGGYHAEYSSMKLGFYLFAEYINMFISSAVMASLYFGGYDIPFVDEKSWGLSANMLALIGGAVLMAKIAFFLFFFMWVRWTIPRFRYDQLMNLGWKSLIPLALLNMLVSFLRKNLGV